MRARLLFPLLLLFGCKKEKPAEPPPPPPPAQPSHPGHECLGVDVAPEEIKCKIATECGPVLGVCGGCYQGVNLNKRSAVAGRISQRNLATSCRRASPPLPKLDCVEQKCTVVGFQTGPSAACVGKAADVRRAINRSRACEADADCTSVAFGCPFGCRTPVAKAAAVELKKTVQAYFDACPACPQNCGQASGPPVCDQGLCSSRRGSIRRGVQQR